MVAGREGGRLVECPKSVAPKLGGIPKSAIILHGGNDKRAREMVRMWNRSRSDIYPLVGGCARNVRRRP